MKRVFGILLTLTLTLVAVDANAITYYISAPRFVRPLIEHWIELYKNINPDVEFAIAKSAADREASQLAIELSEEPLDNGKAFQTVYFGEYAVLPVAIKDSEAADLLADQQLNQKRLKSLFFVNEDFEQEGKKDKNSTLVVYTGSSATSASIRFASYFGKNVSNFKGKRIVGDDQFLTAAISKDSKGVTINSLPNIYDLKTRQLKQNLILVPLDVDKSVRVAFSETATLDQLLEALEAGKTDAVPVGKVGIAFNDANAQINSFIRWILSEGRNYNHQYGLLSLDDKTIAKQTEQLTTNYTAQK